MAKSSGRSQPIMRVSDTVSPHELSTVCRPMQNTISKSEGKALMKLVVNADDDKLLGAHMVGPEAAEIMQVGHLLHN